MMEKYVFLIAVLAGFATGELEVIRKISRGYFNITCLSRDYNSDGIKYPLSMVISRPQEGNGTNVASVSIYKSESNFTGSTIYSSLSSITSDPYISLVWTNFDSSLDGEYTCTLHGLDADNSPRSVSQEIIIAVQELDPVISTSPQHFLNGVTRSLVVECSLASPSLHGLSEPLLLEIIHYNKGIRQKIASASYGMSNGSSGIDTTAEHEWEVENVYADEREDTMYIEIIKDHPTAIDSGMYTCDVSGASVNGSDETVRIRKSATVTSSEPTSQDIYTRASIYDDLQGYFFWKCSFEEGLCGIDLNNSSSSYKWKFLWSRDVQDPDDHTLQDNTGHYIRADIPSGAYATIVAKTSLLPAINNQFCLSFWFFHSGSSGSLRVNAKSESGYTFYSGNSLSGSQYWSFMKLPMSAITETFTLEFGFERVYSNYYYYNSNYYYNSYSPQAAYAAIDDIVISDINC